LRNWPEIVSFFLENSRFRHLADIDHGAPDRHTVTGMVTILSAIVSIFAFRFRSRAALELKLIAVQHQVAVLR
jgi:hypothetical protein